jgi:uncharacterized protein YbgA (DUF1722 family)
MGGSTIRGCATTSLSASFAYRRVTALFRAPWSMGDVVHLHTAHQLTLMAHRPAELLALIEDYAAGVPYLADQVCLRPHPVELMLRNHV